MRARQVLGNDVVIEQAGKSSKVKLMPVILGFPERPNYLSSPNIFLGSFASIQGCIIITVNNTLNSSGTMTHPVVAVNCVPSLLQPVIKVDCT